MKIDREGFLKLPMKMRRKILRMQAKELGPHYESVAREEYPSRDNRDTYCPACGMLRSQCQCWDPVNQP